MAAPRRKFLDVFAGRATAVATNIAGPSEPVSLVGVPLRGFTAWVPSTGGRRLARPRRACGLTA